MKFLATAFVLLAAVAMLVQASPMLRPPGKHHDSDGDSHILPYGTDMIFLPHDPDVSPHDPDVSPPFEKFLQDHTKAVKKLNDTIKALKKESKTNEKKINDIYGAAYNVEKVAKEFVDKHKPVYKTQPIED
ncbi:12582_t:CDS:2 [Cetraspora pellucida]|uniref:12582_t:CDS:1 n=1 Tax=Cetraspora pellucida TaxID=1433469 RepID=A0ACA9L4G4_9GLOM|nr:12582_t:CDS:2 [Cetraspora pellucida]